MTAKAVQIPPEAYLQGLTLWEAIFDYGDTESIGIYNATLETPERVAPAQGAGMLDILNTALQGFQDIQTQQNSRKKIEVRLKRDFLDLMKKGDLIAFGFKMPRNIEDQAVKIPPDLFFGGEIDWGNSELKSQNLEFSGIRIFENTATIIDLTPNKAENPQKQIEITSANKSAKRNFSDLDLELHVDEKKAAEFLGISSRTLQGYRLKGGGPKYRKIGNRTVRYKIQDLTEWSDGNKRENTSEN